MEVDSLRTRAAGAVLLGPRARRSHAPPVCGFGYVSSPSKFEVVSLVLLEVLCHCFVVLVDGHFPSNCAKEILLSFVKWKFNEKTLVYLMIEHIVLRAFGLFR